MLQHYEFLIQRISKRHMRGLLKCEKFKYHAIKIMGEKKVPNKKEMKEKERKKPKKSKQNEQKKKNMEKANSTRIFTHTHT